MTDIDQQVSDIVERKGLTLRADKTDAKVKVTLTPVGTEAAPVGILGGRHPVAFPYDDPQTIIGAVSDGLRLVAQVRSDIDHVENGLNALGALYAGTVAAPPASSPVEAPPTSAPSEDLGDRMARLSAEAQAAAFKGNLVPAAQEVFFGDTVEGWVCPTHGSASIEWATSRKGRKFRQCGATGCRQFER